MAQDWQAFPAGSTNSVNVYTRTVVDPVESVGEPSDDAATSQNSTNTAIALGKGMLAGLGVSAGSGAATVNTSSRLMGDPVRSLGAMDDPPATGDGSDDWSAISLLKGICATAGL